MEPRPLDWEGRAGAGGWHTVVTGATELEAGACGYGRSQQLT